MKQLLIESCHILPHHHFPPMSPSHCLNLLIAVAWRYYRSLVSNVQRVTSIPEINNNFQCHQHLKKWRTTQISAKLLFTSSKSCSLSSSSLLDSTATRFLFRFESLASFVFPILVLENMQEEARLLGVTHLNALWDRNLATKSVVVPRSFHRLNFE